MEVSAESTVSSTKRPSFLADLPCELLPAIVMYLSTQDALAFAAISRFHHEALCDRIYARYIRTEFNGNYPLIWAAEQPASSSSTHALVTARRALAHGADPNAHVFRKGVSADKLCNTPLLMAVGEGCAAMVQLLLEHGADPCAQGEYYSPLQLAAARSPVGDYLGCLRLMLSPADRAQRSRIANHRCGGGRTALHIAAVRGSSHVVRVLLEHEAKVNIHNVEGRTPLHCAIDCGHFATAAVLLEAGADPLALCIGAAGREDRVGVNALDKALSRCSRATFEPASEQNSAEHQAARDFLKLLLARYRKSTADGSRTWVHLPPGRAHQLLNPRVQPRNTAPFIKMLLESGLDPDSRSEPGGTTPLWELAGENCPRDADGAAAAAIATDLLDGGARIDFRDPENGYTPLMRAVAAGNSNIAAVLLSHGADVLQVDNSGRSALALAARDPVSLAAMRLLLDHERDKDSGELSEAMAQLLNRHVVVVVDGVGGDGDGSGDGKTTTTPLLTALESCNVDAARLLLDNGAQAGIDKSQERRGHSTLAIAASLPFVLPLAPLLLEHGAHLDERDGEGWTPLQRAASNGCLGGVEFLIAAGAEVDAFHVSLPAGGSMSSRETALLVAAWQGHLDVAQALVFKGGASTELALECCPGLVARAEEMGDEGMLRLLCGESCAVKRRV